MNSKKFTILHSNDMHSDFFARSTEGREGVIGGLAHLSGYIKKVRHEEENVLYVIAGDMLQGSIIDAEYKGISTMEIMNYLAPDVVCLGNHEFDYGLSHLLFLEKVANFPIVNANLYIKRYYRRLMRPYHIIKMAGFDLLFIGVITEKIMDSLTVDPLIGSFVTLEEANSEIGRITNSYKNDDIDLTVILTHIGLDSDISLARMLQPEWGVDLIIGGHSHSNMSKPEHVNNILIAQTPGGTSHIGRFDILVDDDSNSIVEYEWRLVEINDQVADPDKELLDYIQEYREIVSKKYDALVCKLSDKHTHPAREIETALGNLIADVFAERSECDVMFVSSGSIRSKELGPMVRRMDLLQCFPFDDSLMKFTIPGRTLVRMMEHIMRPENRNSEGECYQVSGQIRAVYNDKDRTLGSLRINSQPVVADRLYTICLQGYHLANCSSYLNVSEEELTASGPPRLISTSSREVLEEYLRNHQNVGRRVEERLLYI